MSLIILNVDEVRRTLSVSDASAFVVNDKNVDVVRFALPTGFADIALDEHSALRVMYQRPGETEVRAQTLTYYDTDGIRKLYDWELLSADLAKSGTLTVALCILRIDSEVEEWHTTPYQIRVLGSIHTDDSDEGGETITPTVAQRVAVLESMIQRVASGAPVVVSSVSEMTDTAQIYVLTTDGKWYYHNGTTWVAGGTYGAVETDTTLTQSGMAADSKAVGVKIEETKGELNYFADTQAKRFYPTWESGGIDGTTGADTTENATRCAEYIDKSTIANFTVNTHTGSLYIYRYEYDADSEAYSYLGANQRAAYGDATNWLKGLNCTHFRIEVGLKNATPDEWLYIGVSNTISTNISKAVNDAQSAINNTENVRYWRHKYIVEPGTKHSATSGEVPVFIPAGYNFSIKEKLNANFNRQFYAYYSDGTNERLYNYQSSSPGHVARNVIVPAKEKDITSFSVYINNSSGAIAKEFGFEVFVENSLSSYEGYTYQSAYWIQNEDGSLTCFEQGRARALVQTIAVVNNEVWEFAEGKACYNGVEYPLDNGHGNNCNWGVTLHGTYPYLYCPTWTLNEMNINVFSFDGSAFTLIRTIHFNGYTGYLDAYVDEADGFIYAFVFANNAAGKCHYLVSDLDGNVLFEKDLPYLIRTIQGICMHNGLIYAVSGFGNTASPNYLYKISPDGALISKNVMGQIGQLSEIEGIDFLDNEMILATYYGFLIHPHRVPRAYRTGYIKQLEASE